MRWQNVSELEAGKLHSAIKWVKLHFIFNLQKLWKYMTKVRGSLNNALQAVTFNLKYFGRE